MNKTLVFFAIAVVWLIMMLFVGEFLPRSEIELTDVISEGITIILIGVWMFATQRLNVSEGARNIMSTGFFIMLLAMIRDFTDEVTAAPANYEFLFLVFESFYPLGFALATAGLLVVVADKSNSLPDTEEEEVSGGLSVNTDAITGLWTRDYMQSHLRNRTSDDFALVFIKLSEFKAISVKHDNSTSLSLLRAMTRVLKKSLQTQDRGFRYGKDVFVCYLPGKSIKQAEQYAQDLQSKFAETTVSANAEQLDCKTQIGVITPIADEKVFDLVQRGIHTMNRANVLTVNAE
ncbi:diguanylate cyclase domain-containing protein [Salinibius halmophilus]|uniref:diguanylate cyclase domain-containing protein n=1 Tax=Salinibius halmophilus TaxID=1853216 RepID=UPI000E67302D|nr:diguanylate cyclase [Salinibius halmophilus]